MQSKKFFNFSVNCVSTKYGLNIYLSDIHSNMTCPTLEAMFWENLDFSTLISYCLPTLTFENFMGKMFIENLSQKSDTLMEFLYIFENELKELSVYDYVYEVLKCGFLNRLQELEKELDNDKSEINNYLHLVLHKRNLVYVFNNILNHSLALNYNIQENSIYDKLLFYISAKKGDKYNG